MIDEFLNEENITDNPFQKMAIFSGFSVQTNMIHLKLGIK